MKITNVLILQLVLLLGEYMMGESLRVSARTIDRVQFQFGRASVARPIKIPVWPVWGGVAAQVLEWAGQRKLAANVLNTVGGRVVPATSLGDISPFLLLAHHTHSFTPFDPTRQIVNMIQPEGFPAHPHAGFHTVTITLEGSGGLRHRDSSGEQSSYGNGDTQFMRAGAGIIHEEMWDVNDNKHTPIEIYQLWVNSPQKDKFKDSRTQLVKGSENIKRKVGSGGDIDLICGNMELLADGQQREYIEGPGTNLLDSPTCIMLLTLGTGKCMELVANVDDAVSSEGVSMAIYIRRGSLMVEENGEQVEAFPGEIVSFDTSESAERALATLQSGTSCGDFSGLVMIGQNLGEEVIQRGPFVQASNADLARAARPFQSMDNIFWEHTISDAEWKDHVNSMRLQEVLRQSHQ